MKAAIFDLDGTLVDSAPGLWHAVNALLVERRLPPLSLDRVAGFIGHGVGRFVQGVMANAGELADPADIQSLVDRFAVIYNRDPLRDCQLYDGVSDVLEALRQSGWTIGLCTNKPESIARAMLADLGIAPLIAVVTGGDTLPQRKPDPRPLLHTVAQLHVEGPNVVYVGDSEIDAEAAIRAHLPFAFHSGGYHNGGSIRADLSFARFEPSLPEALAALVG